MILRNRNKGKEIKEEVVVFRISDILTLNEASEEWGIKRNTLYQHITRTGKFKDEYFDSHIRFTQGIWLISRQAMYKAFGDPADKEKKETPKVSKNPINRIKNKKPKSTPPLHW